MSCACLQCHSSDTSPQFLPKRAFFFLASHSESWSELFFSGVSLCSLSLAHLYLPGASPGHYPTKSENSQPEFVSARCPHHITPPPDRCTSSPSPPPVRAARPFKPQPLASSFTSPPHLIIARSPTPSNPRLFFLLRPSNLSPSLSHPLFFWDKLSDFPESSYQATKAGLYRRKRTLSIPHPTAAFW